MRISRRLNLVLPVDTERGEIYVHSTPISREVFERHFLVLSKTFAAIYQEGLTVTAGPRVAALMLRQIATDMGVWEGPDGVENGLVAEIRRLTNVITPKEEGGYQILPYHDALRQKLLDADDVSEIEGVLSFFTVVSQMHRPNDLVTILAGMGSLWGVQTTLSNSTEFASSLPISTTAATTGETSTPSAENTLSVPL